MKIISHQALNKFLRGNDHRKSRLHDRHGNFVPLGRLILNGPRAFSSYFILKLFGVRPIKPWISYSANTVIARKLMEAPATVLEFGSGMSTLWFARHARQVCSIEHDPEWFEMVKKRLAKGDKHSIIDYELATTRMEYSNFKSSSSKQYDVILIDGPWRAECLEHHMHLIKKGGIIYLDNSDAESSSGEEGEIEHATKVLNGFAKERDAIVERFTDFGPTCLFVTQGLLVRVP